MWIEEEKKEWIQIIQVIIEKYKQNSEIFKVFGGVFSQDEDFSFFLDVFIMSISFLEFVVIIEGGLGVVGFEFRKLFFKIRCDKEKQSCKSCGEIFNFIMKRRYYCKLCGVVICGKCFEFKVENSWQSCVCRQCFLIQLVVFESFSFEVLVEFKQSIEKIFVVDVQFSLFCGFLWLLDSGEIWSEVWVVIFMLDFQVLYLQGGSQDGWLFCIIFFLVVN